MKRDIQDESCSNTASVAKKLKEESKITFRFEGNKKQFQFNSDLAEKVKSASVALGKRKLDLVKIQLNARLTGNDCHGGKTRLDVVRLKQGKPYLNPPLFD